jgi:hypothetical protein
VNSLFEDLDNEMKRRGVDAVMVIGESTLGNPELVYVTGTTIPRGRIFLKPRGQRPLLIVSNIDVGGAKRGRVREIQTYTDYDYEKPLKQHGQERGYIKFLDLMLQSLGILGDTCI